MAFKPPSSSDLPALLAGRVAIRSFSCNPLRAMTLGIVKFTARFKPQIDLHVKAPSKSDDVNIAYSIEVMLAKGTFSQIYSAVDLLQQPVVIKVVPASYSLLGVREVAFLRHLKSKCGNGKNIFVDILDSYRADGCVCIVLPRYRCTLLDLLRFPDELSVVQVGAAGAVTPSYSNLASKRAGGGRGAVDFNKLARIAADIGCALCVLRTEGIIHGDIKPENIFLESNSRRICGGCSGSPDGKGTLEWDGIPEDCVVKVGDFGSSVHISEALKFFTDFSIQSLPYRSPEVLLGVPFGQQIDMWSVGVLLAELCLGVPLFTPDTPQELYDQYCKKLTEPSPQRFAGGRLYHAVTSKKIASQGVPLLHIGPGAPGGASFGTLASSTAMVKTGMVDFSRHVGVISSLFTKVYSVPPSLVHLIAGLLHPDPDVRLSAPDYMQHSFLSSSIGIPVPMLGIKQPQRLAEVNSSINSLHQSKRRRLMSPNENLWRTDRGKGSRVDSNDSVNNDSSNSGTQISSIESKLDTPDESGSSRKSLLIKSTGGRYHGLASLSSL